MSWAWTRTYYSEMDGRIYNFEAKQQRDTACRELRGMQSIPAIEAYKHPSRDIIQVWYHKFGSWLNKIKEERQRHED